MVVALVHTCEGGVKKKPLFSAVFSIAPRPGLVYIDNPKRLFTYF